MQEVKYFLEDIAEQLGIVHSERTTCFCGYTGKTGGMN